MPHKQWSLERLRNESAYSRSCILITAGHLGLFAWIGKREKTSIALAAHFGGSPAVWEIFCNALCAMGLLRKRGKKYANAVFSLRHLSGNNASFLLPEYDAWKAWGDLAFTLRSGKRPEIHRPFFSDGAKARRLLDALHIDAQKIAPQLIGKLPLKNSKTFLDVGGGLGAFSIAFCRRYAKLQATLIEHPRTVSMARRAIAQAGLSKRIRVIGLDFSRRNLPRGFDTVLVSNILHSQSVEENRSLLLKIRTCLNPKGHLILRDVFMSRDRTTPEWAALFSVALLLHTPKGRCYALGEILSWLRQAGFSRVEGPFPSTSLSFDPDSILIAKRS
jgi:cyclopropane fatty-acyl-phospholipid synthase-like methyltransferase